MAKSIDKHLKLAAAIVNSWPKWKQNILVDSLKPMLDTPRKPIINK